MSGESESGGGVFCFSNNCAVIRCIIAGNQAYNSGGGIYCYYGGNITDCTIAGNMTINPFADGGGISCYYGGNVINCDIIDNKSYVAGGIMLYSGGDANKCFISENVADLFGGGAYCFQGGTITDCGIAENISSNFGGGFFARFGGCARRCRIVNNATIYGGGACLDSGGSLTNCLIIDGNTAEFGGGVYIKNNGAIHSCTISGNNASQKGGGIVCSNADGEVANSIIYHNSAFTEGNNWYIESPSNLIFSYCCSTLAHFLPGANGCISNDPEFINLYINDYTLEDFSPCRNAGYNLPWALAPGAIDLDHNPRIEEITIDMGCYEIIPEPSLFIIYFLSFITYYRKKLKL